MRFLEDFHPGDVTAFGAVTVVEDEVIGFATAYDPQPFHINRAAAAASHFGGIIASGWHTIAMTCRLFADNVMHDTSLIGGVGADAIRWLKPVRPGDVLTVRSTILETRRSRSKPDRGTVHIQLETFDQTGDAVLTLTVTALLGVRPEPA